MEPVALCDCVPPMPGRQLNFCLGFLGETQEVGGLRYAMGSMAAGQKGHRAMLFGE